MPAQAADSPRKGTKIPCLPARDQGQKSKQQLLRDPSKATVLICHNRGVCPNPSLCPIPSRCPSWYLGWKQEACGPLEPIQPG